MCEKLVEGFWCDDVECENRHPYFCKHFEREGSCSWGLRSQFRHQANQKEKVDKTAGKVKQIGAELGK